jgi:sugar transferase (PEP-CTERM/EpsH1 system associated)
MRPNEKNPSPDPASPLPEVLFIAHRVPFPPDRGDRIRSWNMIQYLSDRARVSLACVTEEPISWRTTEALLSTCHRVAIAPVGRRGRWIHAGAHWLSGKSLTEGLFWSRKLADTIDYWSDVISFDHVFVFCSSMLPYAERPGLRSIPRVVDLVDVDSQKWKDYANNASFIRRRIYRSEAKRVERLETSSVNASKAVLLASEAEAGLLRDQQRNRKASVLGIRQGVDLAYFKSQRSRGKHAIPSLRIARTSSQLRLIFVGVLDYRPNVEGLDWFLKNVWTLLRIKVATASLEIVGKNPTPRVRQFGNHPGVHVIGEVSDVRPYLDDADVAIAPLQIARGIQNKVLEAMAMEKPVVLSPLAAEGIDALPDKHYVIADSAEQWRDQLVTLAKYPEARLQLGAAAREFVEREFDWAVCLEPLDALLGIPPKAAKEHQHARA